MTEPGLPTDPKLEKVFQTFDRDDSGTLDRKELKTALAKLNVKNLTQKELESIVASVDVNHDDRLSLPEFASIFGQSKLRSVFCEIDADGSGTITTHELQTALAKLGHTHVSPAQISSMLRKVDRDTSGQVDFAEFREFFRFVPATSLGLLAKSWMDEVSVDCGSDLSPPIVSPSVPWYYAVLGGLGGVASRTLTAPLEKVKLEAQTQGRRVNLVADLRATYRRLGARGLLAGNASNCLRVFPYTGIVTWCYLRFLRCTPVDDELDPMEPLYRGACAIAAGIAGQLATYPLDVVRARMTTRPGRYNGIAEALAGTVAKEGFGGVYKGLVPTLLAVGPFLAFQHSTADALKSLCAETNTELTTPLMAGIGGTAGVVAQTVVYPLDVLRRRLQVDVHRHTSAVQAARHLIRTEGVRSLFAGIGVTYLKVFPTVAIAMTCTKEMIGYSKRNWE